MLTFAAPFEKRALEKFIEKTVTVQASTEKKYNLSRSVNSFVKELWSVSIKLEIYKDYTMKSLILAQDER